MGVIYNHSITITAIDTITSLIRFSTLLIKYYLNNIWLRKDIVVSRIIKRPSSYNHCIIYIIVYKHCSDSRNWRRPRCKKHFWDPKLFIELNYRKIFFGSPKDTLDKYRARCKPFFTTLLLLLKSTKKKAIYFCLGTTINLRSGLIMLSLSYPPLITSAQGTNSILYPINETLFTTKSLYCSFGDRRHFWPLYLHLTSDNSLGEKITKHSNRQQGINKHG